MRRTKEGIHCNLGMSGFHKSWWPFAGRTFWFAHNTEVANGTSAYAQRHGDHGTAYQVPLGLLVDYMPTASPKEMQRQKDWEPRTRTGLFVGYHLQPGGVWSGDYYVVDFEKLQTDPNATPGQCRVHRTAEIF